MSGLPALAGSGVTEGLAQAVAAAAGLSAAFVAGGPAVLLAGDAAALESDASWLPPVFAVIEAMDADPATLGGIARRATRYDFFYSVGVFSAAELPLARRIARFIGVGAPGIGVERLQDVELALHEAVSNALVHGNLGVVSMQAATLAALDAYSGALQSGLTDPALSRRRVEVRGRIQGGAVAVDVVDEGAGYEAKPVSADSPCGRGLELIGALTRDWQVLDGGRRLSMRFDG